MPTKKLKIQFKAVVRVAIGALWFSICLAPPLAVAYSTTPSAPPVPLLAKGHPVSWWFVFKLNSKVFPGCGGTATRACRFGGTVQNYKSFSQQFIYASSDDRTLQQGAGCAGDTTTEPIGATFDEVYKKSYHFVVWNDQFHDAPKISGCPKFCGAPWGHSKGMVVWNDAGEGLVMQVTTPSWPGSGSKDFPRNNDGNTLGCVIDNDVLVSQHFFALEINKDDLITILKALQNSSVVTDPKNRQLVNNGGPADVQQLVKGLGVRSGNQTVTSDKLSSGVTLISKPSALNVPPWQMVSAVLNGVSLRAATWWETSKIPTTTASTQIKCWDASLGKPGPVEIATTGEWAGKTIGLTGGPHPD
ncbi:MAG: deoxyribonuclease II family protein, partial [Pyrinomonadaceae bacterium]